MIRFKSISEFIDFRGLPSPSHPLIYVLKIEPVETMIVADEEAWSYDFYAIALKRVAGTAQARLKYGQGHYDYNQGIMSFVAPGQILKISANKEVQTIQQSGWMLLVHPDFFYNTSLAQSIRNYDFWDYAVNEALHVSEKEEQLIINILHIIQQETFSNTDNFSKNIMVSHLDNLLNYADRFYHRQFLTREKANHQVLQRLENLLINYFNDDNLISKGLPSVAFVAESLNLSPKYLSSLLKVLTGLNTQQHIHEKLIARAKEKLSVSQLSISEIAYGLGFEHVQSFTKLFKSKTTYSPVEFRRAFK